MPSTFHIITELLRDLYGSGEIVNVDGKRYTVHRMSYGDYFLQPEGWKGGERDGFAPGTLWLKPCGEGHRFGPGYVIA